MSSRGAVLRGWRASYCAWLVAGTCWLPSACGSEDATDATPAGAGRAPTLVPSNTGGAAGARDDRGVPLGRFVHTFYWMEFETDYSGSADTDLAGSDCRVLATVPQAFAER